MSDQREIAIQLMREQRFGEAKVILLRLLHEQPNDWGLNYMVGQCCRFTGSLEDAVKFLGRAHALNLQDANVLLALGVAYQMAGQYPQAIDALKNAVKHNPGLFSAYNSLALTFRLMGDMQAALLWYTRAEEGLVSAVCDVVYQDEEKCFGEGIVDGKKILVMRPYAMEAVHERLRADSLYAVIKNNKGVCLQALGEFEAARASFEEAIEFIPDGVNYLEPHQHLAAIA